MRLIRRWHRLAQSIQESRSRYVSIANRWPRRQLGSGRGGEEVPTPTDKSHLATSWSDQRNRIGRWHKRLSALGRGVPTGMSKEEALDDLFAFFMNCYHLRDWVIGSG